MGDFKKEIKMINEMVIKFHSIKRPKFKMPEIYLGLPPRWLIVTIAILILIAMIFLLFWLFDDKTMILNDWVENRSYGIYNMFGWKHKAINTVAALSTVAWIIVILSEFLAYTETNRPFYKLYN